MSDSTLATLFGALLWMVAIASMAAEEVDLPIAKAGPGGGAGVVSPGVVSTGVADSLFAATPSTEDAPLAVTLTGPWSALARDKAPDPENRPATLQLGAGKSFNLEVRPRGKSRRISDNCAFPPVRLDFKRSEVVGSLFAGQNKLKLVTHCGRLGTSSQKFSDQLHSEYLLYRIFNELTEASFRVRLLDITWVDSERGKRFNHPGFLIEHKNALAQRLGATLETRSKIPLTDLDARYSALAALFAYFTGNTDYSFMRGPEDDDCCHNSLPLRMDGGGATRSIPYDFDATGFVQPKYAQPAQGTGLNSVSQRLHRGYCEHENEVPAAIEAFQATRSAIVQRLTDYPAITDARRKKLLRYSDAFYRVLDDPAKVRKRLLRRCR